MQRAKKVQRTELLHSVCNDLNNLALVAKELGLTSIGGFYRLRTPIDSVVYKKSKIEVVIYDNNLNRYRIDSIQQDGNLISWMGYDKEWWLSSNKEFPLMIEDTDYVKDVLELITNWKTSYDEIERNLVEDCHKILRKSFESCL